jgi:hypothetical protein
MKRGHSIKLERLIICFIICSILINFTQISYAFSYFHGTGLLDTPTAYILDNGVFDTGIDILISDSKRQEMSFKLDFGLLNFSEFGIVCLKKDNKDFITGNAKFILAREEGILPAFAFGVDNVGEDIDKKDDKYNVSFYAVISKQFNLPLIHLINTNLGFGNKRYVDEESIGKYLHGGFIGLNKDILITSRDMRLSFIGEIKGNGINIGLKCLLKSGLGVNLAVGQLASGDEVNQYHFGISFTNAQIIKEISQSIGLSKQAVRISNEAKSKADDNKN